jgi:hypothetical protein
MKLKEKVNMRRALDYDPENIKKLSVLDGEG